MFSKINLIINIVIALSYNGCSNITLIGHPDASLGFFFGLPFLIIVHIIILGVIAMILESKKPKKAQGYIYSLIFVLVIGICGFCTPLVFSSLY